MAEVQVDLRGGLPGLDIIGLPDRAVSEAARRVRAALANAGFRIPPRKVVVNLAPADLPKRGPGLDLPIAVGLMVAGGGLAAGVAQGKVFWGQLALDGRVQTVPGAIAIARAAQGAGRKAFVAAPTDAAQAALTGIEAYALNHLRDLRREGEGRFRRMMPAKEVEGGGAGDTAADEGDAALLVLRGAAGPLRAAAVSAAGGHSVAFFGPPGVGKSLLGQGVHSLLPPPAGAEALDIRTVASLSGEAVPPGGPRRPLRAPLPGCTAGSVFGGGQTPRPGEVTLAHGGVLLLDELPRHRAEVTGQLAVVLDRGYVELGPAGRQTRLPAVFQLVATANLCACGHQGTGKGCVCTRGARRAFWRKLSAPLLDRIDLQVIVAGPDVERLNRGLAGGPAPAGAADPPRLRAAVAEARRVQGRRYGAGILNGSAKETAFRDAAQPAAAATTLLADAAGSMSLSARAFYRVLRVARTIADLDGTTQIEPHHVAEALSYRLREGIST